MAGQHLLDQCDAQLVAIALKQEMITVRRHRLTFTWKLMSLADTLVWDQCLLRGIVITITVIMIDLHRI
jgi:hypothetical protein